MARAEWLGLDQAAAILRGLAPASSLRPARQLTQRNSCAGGQWRRPDEAHGLRLEIRSAVNANPLQADGRPAIDLAVNGRVSSGRRSMPADRTIASRGSFLQRIRNRRHAARRPSSGLIRA